MKTLSAILTLSALTFALANPAHAVCDVARLHVVRSEGAPGGVQLYDLAPANVTPTFYFRYATSNPVIIDHLNSAWVGRFTVRAIGDAAVCPGAGVIRFGGNITFLFRDSFF